MEISDRETDFSQIPNEKVKKANEILLISVFAMFGVLMRQGFDRSAQPIEELYGVPIYNSYFSNFIGCFFIGFFGKLAKDRIIKYRYQRSSAFVKIFYQTQNFLKKLVL